MALGGLSARPAGVKGQLSPQVGFRNNGQVVALDMEHYSNAGSTLDESLMVSICRGVTAAEQLRKSSVTAVIFHSERPEPSFEGALARKCEN